jgi:hypothetical protein
VVLLGIGIFFMAWFFVYEVTSTKFNRDLPKVSEAHVAALTKSRVCQTDLHFGRGAYELGYPWTP